MNRKHFITSLLAGMPAILFARKALALPTVCIYVRINAGAIAPLKYVGCFSVPAPGAYTIYINILDTRTNTWVLRIAYQADGVTPYTSQSPLTITITTITIP